MLRRSRALCFLLAVILVLSGALPVSAAYENAHVNTGNQRRDIVQVALTQLGYREGRNNDTKYGDWYGMSNQPWCAMFVSWCANQAGIGSGVLKKSSLANPNNFGITYYNGASYTPRSGDLFFNKQFRHVGIVYYVDGDYFYTLEGNSNNNGSYDGIGVFSLKRRISSFYFGVPKYLGAEDCTYTKGSEAAHPHKVYYKCSTCGDLYYNGEYAAAEDCKTCIMENCTHQYDDWQQQDSTHSHICSLCTKEESGKHSWKTKVTAKADCTKSGTQEKTCKVCGIIKTETIPQSTQHSYTAWEQVDESTHTRSCTVCKKEQTEKHSFPEQWSSDETGHFYTCVCGMKQEVQPHDFSESCEGGCVVCGYAGENIHSFAEQWSNDAENHWYACENCAQLGSLAAHAFENACDRQCDICGYGRETTHNYGQVLLADESGHWRQCTVCGEKADLAAHSDQAVVRSVNCGDCGYLLTHVHSFDTVLQDKQGHWGVCACGEQEEAQGHDWENSDICPVCQTKKPLALWQWGLLIGIPVLAAATAVLIVLIKKRKKKPAGKTAEPEPAAPSENTADPQQTEV